jgi:hypothetical protein
MLTMSINFDDPKELFGLKNEEAHKHLMGLAEAIIHSGGKVEIQTMPFRREEGKSVETYAALEELPLLHRKLDEFYQSL